MLMNVLKVKATAVPQSLVYVKVSLPSSVVYVKVALQRDRGIDRIPITHSAKQRKQHSVRAE